MIFTLKFVALTIFLSILLIFVTLNSIGGGVPVFIFYTAWLALSTCLINRLVRGLSEFAFSKLIIGAASVFSMVQFFYIGLWAIWSFDRSLNYYVPAWIAVFFPAAGITISLALLSFLCVKHFSWGRVWRYAMNFELFFMLVVTYALCFGLDQKPDFH
jgi:hypothetical protein